MYRGNGEDCDRVPVEHHARLVRTWASARQERDSESEQPSHNLGSLIRSDPIPTVPPSLAVGVCVRRKNLSFIGDLVLRCACCPTGNGLEGTPDLEPDRADLDGEHPVTLVQVGHAIRKCLFGFPIGAQDRD